MIQTLATKHAKSIAASLLFLFYISFVAPLYAGVHSKKNYNAYNSVGKFSEKLAKGVEKVNKKPFSSSSIFSIGNNLKINKSVFNGGPTQPEMSSFKPVGVDNMVNLFTGDFNYNIPLLDVGGYPVNIFYDGGITMEQDASWVGLGWNINPGNVNRNMRGMPDDFNGEDTLIESQNMKPNKTWGVNLQADAEGVGIKDLTLGGSLGVSFNNYLGPAIQQGIKGGLNFTIKNFVKSEKSTEGKPATITRLGDIGGSVGFNTSLSSRDGFTLSPNASLTASLFKKDRTSSIGLNAGTAYNSRYGIRDIQVSGQATFSRTASKVVDDKTVITNKSSNTAGLYSSTISFAKPSYLPTIRMPITNSAFSGHFQLGGAIFGFQGSAEAEVFFQSALIHPDKVIQRKPAVGYIYSEKAMNNPNAVMDFTRLNDKEVTPYTTIISAPQYTYDVFAIQGEGTGGIIRAYRNDLGYVRDNYTASQDGSTSVGFDLGLPGQFGGNFNIVKTPMTISEWQDGNKLSDAIPFKSNEMGLSENVYFRNPGENTVLNDADYSRISGTDLVRFQLGGDGYNPTAEPLLERFSKTKNPLGVLSVTAATQPSTERKRRTQVTTFFTAAEASVIGLEPQIRNYDRNTIISADTLKYSSIGRIDGKYRKAHHISQINVTEANGRRYIYGLPVYNYLQKDFTFSVTGTPTSDNKIAVGGDSRMTTSSSLVTDLHSSRDGYVQVREMPAFANSFLLTGLLSPDYVDVTGNGITEDDLGTAVKFNYSRVEDGNGNPVLNKWRTPLTTGSDANYNAGNLTEDKDDKGLVSYGERESWYLHSVESKTMIAFFTVENRNDGKGAVNEYGGIDVNGNALKRLKQIDLYNKADLKLNGLAGAKPIKTVHFEYTYELCANAPGNDGNTVTVNGTNVNAAKGKLTLKKIYFTYNGKDRANKNQYVFSYTTASGTGNPAYEFNGNDRWGNYKTATENPAGLPNNEYPFVLQNKTKTDQFSGAWSLKRILLPSGGQIEVDYESDDYAYVQNRRAAEMMEIAGFGKDQNTITNRLYNVDWAITTDNNYMFVRVPSPCTTDNEVKQKYVAGLEQIAVKIAVQMPKGTEFITAYCTVESCGKTTDPNVIWIKLNTVNGMSPLALTALEYLREQLPGQAFPGYDVSESSGLKQIGEMLIGMLSSLKAAFRNPIDFFRSKGMAQQVITAQSFVRLNDPLGYKLGGGSRVRSVILKDNWKEMNGQVQYTSVYGQSYDYTTTELFNGAVRTISSGVASYEPAIGAEENPFHNMETVANKLPLGPATYGSMETPVLEAFFPAAGVGYSKVTVRSITGVTPGINEKSRSNIGRQVTEFYTAKDFPVYYNHTSLDPVSDIGAHKASTGIFFYKWGFDSRTLSQGFVVEVNDMHGKMKSQSSYAANDTTLRVNYTENFYRNTGSKGMNEKFDFVYASQAGTVQQGNMGIDVELMTDVREMRLKTNSFEIQAQVDLFPIFLPVWLPFIWPVASNTENNYRAVTTTKLINYHSVVDSVVVIDKGSQVSTKNLAYDAETGQVLVNRTNNEFDQPIYTTSYPAYWAYSGMGLAYKNIGATYQNVSFNKGKITSTTIDTTIFESGDELYLLQSSPSSDGCSSQLNTGKIIWAYDEQKNYGDPANLSFPISTKMIFIDSSGLPYSGIASFKIIRSGKRNMLGENLQSIASIISPLQNGFLRITSNDKVINSNAALYKEKWQTDEDIIYKVSLQYDSLCRPYEIPDCNGYLQEKINPYRKGLLGNYKPYRSMIFYGNRSESDATTQTNISQNGFLSGFTPYWNFRIQSPYSTTKFTHRVSDNLWVWNTESTKFNARGMELENKNALNIYSAAQYGYHKTLPVAIANNTRYNEMAYNGFEDVNYDDRLNNISSQNCSKHFDFEGIANSAIIPAANENIQAHTGKNVLKVNPSSTAIKSFPVTPLVDSFDLYFKTLNKIALINPGGNIISKNVTPVFNPWCSPTQNITTPSCYQPSNMPLSFEPYFNNYVNLNTYQGSYWWVTDSFRNVSGPLQGYYYSSYNSATQQYIKINECKYYSFSLWLDRYANSLSGDALLTVSVEDLNGTELATFTAGDVDISCPDQCSGGYTYQRSTIDSVFLMPGFYSIKTFTQFYHQHDPALTNSLTGDMGFDSRFGYGTNIPGPSYKTLDNSVVCSYSIPMAASDSMLNSTFKLQPSTKMLLSAWVNQSCGSSCDNKVRIEFSDGSWKEGKPFGPVIEGWQRCEFVFDVPASATSMTLKLVNNNSSPLYFDDIRIHPFNANMKSYVYDPITLRLIAELDANNYASFYEYDEEGTLVRTKAETKEGIKTITETRSAKQKNITNLQ